MLLNQKMGNEIGKVKNKEENSHAKSNSKTQRDSMTDKMKNTLRFPNQPASTEQIYLDKRKRFRELVSLQIHKSHNLKDLMIKTFYKERRRRRSLNLNSLNKKDKEKEKRNKTVEKSKLKSNLIEKTEKNKQDNCNLEDNTIGDGFYAKKFFEQCREEVFKNEEENNFFYKDDEDDNNQVSSIEKIKEKFNQEFSDVTELEKEIQRTNSIYNKQNSFSSNTTQDLKYSKQNSIGNSSLLNNKLISPSTQSESDTGKSLQNQEQSYFIVKKNETKEEKVLEIKRPNKKNNNNKIRDKYYTSLLFNNLFIRKKTDFIGQNIFIFDWDDTIMCTTYITPNGFFTDKNLKEFEKKKNPAVFEALENLIIDVLKYSINNGDTYIITNAASGWVEFSARLFFPKVLPLLSKIIIISARGWFEKEFPKNSKMWKLSCFEEIGKVQIKNTVTNLIVLGDSLIEMEAAYTMAKSFQKCFVKTIKLRDTPSPDQLIKQLKLLLTDFDNILKQQASMAISVQKQTKKDKEFQSFKNKQQNQYLTKNASARFNYHPKLSISNKTDSNIAPGLLNSKPQKLIKKSNKRVSSQNKQKNKERKDNLYDITPRDLKAFS